MGGDVMVPNSHGLGGDIGEPMDSLLRGVIDVCGHCASGLINRENIIGILLAKDLLAVPSPEHNIQHAAPC
jgi:Mg2+/Co2+ transporter CorC